MTLYFIAYEIMFNFGKVSSNIILHYCIQVSNFQLPFTDSLPFSHVTPRTKKSLSSRITLDEKLVISIEVLLMKKERRNKPSPQ